MDEKITFSAKDLCVIIDACKQGGVRELAVGGLMLKFSSLVTLQPKANDGLVGPDLRDADHVAQSKEALEIDELLTKEEQLAQLMIEDPVEYERQIVAGELEETVEDDGDGDI